ncbi:MAG: DUF1569 domain-containing protein [Bacteroidota bacterium]
MYPSVFNPETTASLLDRLNKLTPESQPHWGKMSVAQMLAHVNVAYDINYGKTKVHYNWFARLMLKLFVKSTVVGDKPYKKNGQTAPIFIITDERDFTAEMSKLETYLHQMEGEGAAAYEGKESPSFGVLTAQEWSNQFYKHLDHHLTQFGV